MPGGALHSWRRWTLAARRGDRRHRRRRRPSTSATCSSATRRSLIRAWPIACAIDAAATYYVLKTIMPRSGALPFALLIAHRHRRRRAGHRRAAAPHARDPRRRRDAHAGRARPRGAAMRAAEGPRVLAVSVHLRRRCRGWRSTGKDCIPAFALIPDRPVPAARAAARWTSSRIRRTTTPCITPSTSGIVIVQAVLFLFGLVNAGRHR